MKQKHLYSLLDQSYTTIKVAFTSAVLTVGAYDNIEDLGEYDQGPNPINNRDFKRGKAGWQQQGDRGRGYTYKVPLTWGIQKGDTLIVLTAQRGLAFVHVVSVDLKPDIDIDADFDYHWAVQKVDLTEFQELTLKEEQFGQQMIEIERVKQRESLLNSFRESLPEGSAARALFESTTATLAPPIPPQTPPSAPEAPSSGDN